MSEDIGESREELKGQPFIGTEAGGLARTCSHCTNGAVRKERGEGKEYGGRCLNNNAPTGFGEDPLPATIAQPALALQNRLRR